MKTNTIITGDSAEVLKSFPDGCIDLTVTSPPYDNLRVYNGFTFNFESIAKELFRVTKTGGVVVWVVGDATVEGSETGTSFTQALYFKSLGFKLHDTMIYEKYASTWNVTSKRYRQNFEYMFIFSKGSPKTFNPIRDIKVKNMKPRIIKNNRTGVSNYSLYTPKNEYTVRNNIFTYPVGGKKVDHPAVFPEALAKDHINTWSNEGDIVLDCFSGSGTTPKMAKLLNRHYIGIDTSAEYVALANERLAQVERGLTKRAADGGNVAAQNELFG